MEYETVCQFVGQFFLESKLQLAKLAQQSKAVEAKLRQAEADRDAALKLVQDGGRNGSPT
jgi:hypothetical protein